METNGNHMFESKNRSGVIILIVDHCSPVQYKFSQKVNIQVVFEDSLTRTPNFLPQTNEGTNSFKLERRDGLFEISDEYHFSVTDSPLNSSLCNCTYFDRNDPEESKYIVRETISQIPQSLNSTCKFMIDHDDDESHYEGLEVAFDSNEKDVEDTTCNSIINTNSLNMRQKRLNKVNLKTDNPSLSEVKLKDLRVVLHDFRTTGSVDCPYCPKDNEKISVSNNSLKTNVKKRKKSMGLSGRKCKDTQISELSTMTTSKVNEQTKIKNDSKKDILNASAVDVAINKKVPEKRKIKRKGHICISIDSDQKLQLKTSSKENEMTANSEIQGDIGAKNANQTSAMKKKKTKQRKLLEEKSVKCEYCGVVFDCKLDFYNHRRSEGSTHTCPVCGKTEPFQAHLMAHMQSHKPQKGQLSDDAAGNSVYRKRFKMKCDVCDAVVSSMDALKVHTMSHTKEKPYKCCLCDCEGFGCLPSLQYHLKVHQNSDRVHCIACNMSFASRVELGKHQLTHQHKCGLCLEIFPNKTNRTWHYRTVHPDDVRKCKMCCQIYISDADLHKHMVYHRKKTKKEKCPVCGVIVAKLKEHTLALHSSNGDDGKVFSCDLCPAKFRTCSKLERHRLIHTGEKPYCCSKCPKKFRTHGMLRRHLTIHSLQRHHICHTCGKSYSLRCNLVMHMRIHENTRPYSCAFCSQSFNFKCILKRHMKSKHTNDNIVSLTCSYCSQAFSDSSLLAAHVKTVHTLTVTPSKTSKDLQSTSLASSSSLLSPPPSSAPSIIPKQGLPKSIITSSSSVSHVSDLNKPIDLNSQRSPRKPPISLLNYEKGLPPVISTLLNKSNTSASPSVVPTSKSESIQQQIPKILPLDTSVCTSSSMTLTSQSSSVSSTSFNSNNKRLPANFLL